MRRLNSIVALLLLFSGSLCLLTTSSLDLSSRFITDQGGIAQAEDVHAAEILDTPSSPFFFAKLADIPAESEARADLNSHALRVSTPDEILRNASLAEQVSSEEAASEIASGMVEQPFYELGDHLKLLPSEAKASVKFPGTIQFLAQLTNPHRDRAWRIQIEATVTNNDGSTRTAVNSRVLLLFPGQSLEMPIKFKAKEPKYQPGLTLFTAFIKDMSGQIIDQATIRFNLERTDEQI